MKFDRIKPCNECPFRRKSLKGWLGGGDATSFVGDTMNDALMPCHTDKGFIVARDKEHTQDEWQQALLSDKVQHCAGARIFHKNQCKQSRNPLYLKALAEGKVKPVDKSADVFSWRHEFIQHHEDKGNI